MKTTTFSRSLVFLLAFLFGSALLALPAYAAFISPTKIFINSGQSSASVSITNNGDETSLYTFEWERRTRSEDNKNTYVLKEGETFANYQPADPYLIFSPRRVVVRPGETQRIRIFARRPKDMAAGEYRSHLKISSESTTPEGKNTKPQGGGSFGGTFAVKPAISLPVMLRTGKTVVDIKISNVRNYSEAGFEIIEATLQNNSTRTLYGKGKIKCVGTNGAESEIEMNGFRLYTETRSSVEKFAMPKGTSLAGCASADLELIASREADYSRTPVATAKVK